MTVTILGLPQLQAKLAALPAAVERAAREGRDTGSRRIAEIAALNAPQLTGAMAESIDTDGETVGVGEPYSPFVEFGTTHMSAQPFLGPAFEQEQMAAVDDVANAVRVSLLRV